MINLRYCFSNIIRKPVFVVLIVLQITIAFILLYTSLGYKRYITSNITRSNQTFSNKKTLYKISDLNDFNPNKIKEQDLKLFSDYLKKNNQFNFIFVSDEDCFIKTFNGKESFLKSFNTLYQNNIDYVLVYKLVVDGNFFKNFGVKIKTGTMFDNSSFNVKGNDSIPVILGSKYSNIYKLGDEIDLLNSVQEPMKLKVIGFLDEGAYFSDGGSSGQMISLDNYIIYPQQSPESELKGSNSEYKNFLYKVMQYRNVFNGYIKIDNITSSNKIIVNIISESKKYDLRIKLQNSDESFNKTFQAYKQIQNISNFLFIVIFIFTSVGFISCILYSILKRSREFGIHLMYGATIKDIATRIFYEVFFITILSYFISILFIANFFNYDHILKINLYNFIYTLCVVIILSIAISIIPILKVVNLQITNLIKGDE